MRLIFYFALNTLLFFSYASAQPYFERRYGSASNDEAYAIENTADGGFIVTGRSQARTANDFDIFLLKLDVNGNQVWFRTIANTGDDLGRGIVQMPDLGYIVAGEIAVAGGLDYTLAKFDEFGNFLWQKTYNGYNNDRPSYLSITNDGGLMLTGYGEVAFGSAVDCFVLKTDASGTLQWARGFDGTSNEAFYGFTEVSDSLHNVGVINLGQGSFVNTANYYNVSTGTISAPASVSDTASYAKLIISGVSNNATYINGRVIVHDQTLVSTISNIGYGFDQISNANRIGNTVLFAAKSVAPGTGTGGGSPTPVSSCPLIAALYQLNASASSTAICPGASVNLSSQLNFQIFSIIFPINIPSNSYTWSPTASFSNPTQQNQVVSPTSTTTYTVKVSVFPGCFFTKTVNIVVTPNTAVIAANQTGLLCFSSTGLVLNSTITSGGLSTLQWYLNGNPISGATNANYTPTQAGTYLLNVSGTCGVANSNAITIFPKPTVSISSNFLGICNGNPITLTANLGANSGSGIVYQWTQNTSNVGTNANTYLASSAGNYAVTATNSNGCVGNSNSITIAVSANLFANAGPDQIYVSTPVSIGGNPSCATGGVTPYSYAWSTTAGFVSGAVNQCNNTVAPSATTIYTLTVTDASGCQAKDDVQVVRIGNVISYIVPKKSVDGGYQIPVTNKVYFKFDEEYKNNTISYKIFDYNITAPGNQPANVLCGLNTSLKNLGDNRYYIDLTTCAGSLSASKYYLVEVTNDKNEKFFFKFLN